MKDKYYIRKFEGYHVWAGSMASPVTVEPLRKCEPPFTGETEEDLVKYLEEECQWNEGWLESAKKAGMPEEEAEAIYCFEDWSPCEMTVIDDSRSNGEISCMQVGELKEGGDPNRVWDFRELTDAPEGW